MQPSGDVLHIIENFHGDASLGSFKARLKQADIDFSFWHSIVVGPESFDLANDYCKFMLTEAVKQCGKRLATSPTVSNRRLRLRLRWSGQPETASSTAAAAEFASSTVAAAKSASSIAAADEYATLTAPAVPSRPQKKRRAKHRRTISKKSIDFDSLQNEGDDA